MPGPLDQADLAERARQARANIGEPEPTRSSPALASWHPNEEQAARLMAYLHQASTPPPIDPLKAEYLRTAQGMDTAARATFLRDVGLGSQHEEHAALGQFMTEQFGPLGALGIGVAAPVYAATKGIVQALPQPIARQLPYWNATPPSWGEVGSVYKGIWQGLTAPTNDLPPVR